MFSLLCKILICYPLKPLTGVLIHVSIYYSTRLQELQYTFANICESLIKMMGAALIH